VVSGTRRTIARLSIADESTEGTEPKGRDETGATEAVQLQDSEKIPPLEPTPDALPTSDVELLTPVAPLQAGEVTEKAIRIMLDNIEIANQARSQAQNSLALKYKNLALALTHGQLVIQEFDAGVADAVACWASLQQQLEVDIENLHITAQAMLGFVGRHKTIPELHQMSVEIQSLVPNPQIGNLVTAQEWSRTLHEKWAQVLGIIREYAELRVELRQVIHSILTTEELLCTACGDDRRSSPERPVLDDWESRVGEWKSLKVQTFRWHQDLLDELQTRRQCAIDGISAVQAELRSMLEQGSLDPSIEQNISVLLGANLESMSLIDLMSFNSRIDQVRRQAQSLMVPTERDEVVSILNELAAEPNPDLLLAKHPETFMGRLLLRAANLGVMPSSLLWNACTKVLSGVRKASRSTASFYQTYGYSIVSAALEQYLSERRLIDAIGFAKAGFLPQEGIQLVWRHPEVVRIIGGNGTQNLISSLAKISSDSLTSGDLSVLFSLTKVALQIGRLREQS
jgi:hypothetical protein